MARAFQHMPCDGLFPNRQSMSHFHNFTVNSLEGFIIQKRNIVFDCLQRDIIVINKSITIGNHFAK